MIQDSFSDHGFGAKRARCISCHRELTDPKSVEMGMGPICAAKAKDQATALGMDIFLHEPPLRERIVLREIDGKVATNVPNAIGHSWGFSWGYGGSGPTNLAMNVMEIALSYTDYDASKKVDYAGKKVSALAWSLGHGFKAQFLVHMDVRGGDIPWEDVEAWVHARLNEEVSFDTTE